MNKRFGLFGVGVISSVCVFLLFASNHLSNNYSEKQTDFLRNIQSYPDINVQQEFNLNSLNLSLPLIKDIIDQQKLALEQDFVNFQLPEDKKLEDFTSKAGGIPLRNIIVTTWRSGSTFLGEIINTTPGNYYHYEPLLDYEIMQIRGPPFANSALRNLKNLLSCNYTNMKHYLEYGKTHVHLFTHNTRLWDMCQQYPQYCWNSTFLNEFCQLFPFQSMKIVRLRLKLAEELLRDKSLNVRILLLVRDPRGTLQSRKHRDWCPGQPDCDQPHMLCMDMVADYAAALRLNRLYPDRFRAIRYEDFSLDPYQGVSELFDFFQLPIHPNVIEFLDSHTRTNAGGVSSTFRNSRSAPFHWRLDLNFSEVQYIEEQCLQAMEYWGYVRAHNETNLRKMNPLADFTVSSL